MCVCARGGGGGGAGGSGLVGEVEQDGVVKDGDVAVGAVDQGRVPGTVYYHFRAEQQKLLTF